jgi:hypothetical protein
MWIGSTSHVPVQAYQASRQNRVIQTSRRDRSFGSAIAVERFVGHVCHQGRHARRRKQRLQYWTEEGRCSDQGVSPGHR